MSSSDPLSPPMHTRYRFNGIANQGNKGWTQDERSATVFKCDGAGMGVCKTNSSFSCICVTRYFLCKDCARVDAWIGEDNVNALEMLLKEGATIPETDWERIFPTHTTNHS
jgi:hypothetical protein